MNLKLTSVIILLFFSSCTSNLTELKYFSLEIPEDFETRKDPRNPYEILVLKYKDELFINIKDIIGEGTKDGGNDKKEFSIEDIFDKNFRLMMLSYEGKMSSKLKHSKINGFETLSRDFRAQIPDGDEVYFEYLIMKINDRYFEFTFTGKNNTRKEHKFLLDKLLNSIVEN